VSWGAGYMGTPVLLRPRRSEGSDEASGRVWRAVEGGPGGCPKGPRLVMGVASRVPVARVSWGGTPVLDPVAASCHRGSSRACISSSAPRGQGVLLGRRAVAVGGGWWLWQRAIGRRVAGRPPSGTSTVGCPFQGRSCARSRSVVTPGGGGRCPLRADRGDGGVVGAATEPAVDLGVGALRVVGCVVRFGGCARRVVWRVVGEPWRGGVCCGGLAWGLGWWCCTTSNKDSMHEYKPTVNKVFIQSILSRSYEEIIARGRYWGRARKWLEEKIQ